MSDGIRDAEGKRPSWMEQTHPATGESVDVYTMHANQQALRDNLARAATTAAADRETIATLRARCERLEKRNVELRTALTEARGTMHYAVYPGSERLDLGPKRMIAMCETEGAAKYLARMWGEFGYYERFDAARREAPDA